MGRTDGTRRHARERALQFLFQIEQTREDWHDAISLFWEHHAARPGARRYAELLIAETTAHRDEIDRVLSDALEHWTLNRLGIVERSVLRLAACELLYCPDVPPKVAIDEAVDVTKKFATEKAGSFVNGVLDRIKTSLENGAISPTIG